jgi:hypothetical protein
MDLGDIYVQEALIILLTIYTITWEPWIMCRKSDVPILLLGTVLALVCFLIPTWQ